MDKAAASKLAGDLARTALTKRAGTMDQIMAWFQGLSPEARNAIIGGLVGGAGTGLTSAFTGGNVLTDLLLGGAMGGLAGAGGTAAYRLFANRASGLPSASVSDETLEKARQLSAGEGINFPYWSTAGHAGAGAAVGGAIGHKVEEARRFSKILAGDNVTGDAPIKATPTVVDDLRDKLKATSGYTEAQNLEGRIGEQTARLTRMQDRLAGIARGSGRGDSRAASMQAQIANLRMSLERDRGLLEGMGKGNYGTGDVGSAAQAYRDALTAHHLQNSLHDRKWPRTPRRALDYLFPGRLENRVNRNVVADIRRDFPGSIRTPTGSIRALSELSPARGHVGESFGPRFSKLTSKTPVTNPPFKGHFGKWLLGGTALAGLYGFLNSKTSP